MTNDLTLKVLDGVKFVSKDGGLDLDLGGEFWRRLKL